MWGGFSEAAFLVSRRAIGAQCGLWLVRAAGHPTKSQSGLAAERVIEKDSFGRAFGG